MKRLDHIAVPIDNDNAWADAVADVKKLPETEEKPQAPLIIGNITPKINYAAAYSGNALASLEIGNTDNIDRRTAEKFKRGEFPIERTLDLHGLTEKEAFSAVDDFIRHAYMQKLRCVLIVTGKGINHENDAWYEKKGILKECVPGWLNNPELRPLILGISYAKQEDGGTGALYVLLRRSRQNRHEPAQA